MIATLARMLGLSRTDAEASMHCERAARAVLTRRDLFAAGAAMASGAVFSMPPGPVIEQWGEMWIADVRFPGIATFTYSLDNGRTHSAPQAIPASRHYEIAEAGVTLTFPPLDTLRRGEMMAIKLTVSSR